MSPEDQKHFGACEGEGIEPAPVGPSRVFPYFVCPECGPRVKVDEDQCCAGCGEDCTVEVGRDAVSTPKNLKGLDGAKRALDRALSCIADFTEAAQYARETDDPRAALSVINAMSGHVTHAAAAAGEWAALACVVDGTYMDPSEEP